jgi:transcriptional regulator with XRE-family HTH domain
MRDLPVIKKKPEPGREPWDGVPLPLADRLTFACAAGAEIANARERRGWNQRTVADMCGISAPMLSRIEAGVRPLDMDKLSALCAVIGVLPHRVVTVAETIIAGKIVTRHQCALCDEWFTGIDAWCDHVDNTCSMFQARRHDDTDWRTNLA